MSPDLLFLLVPLLALGAYVVRGNRIIGRRLTENGRLVRETQKKLKAAELSAELSFARFQETLEGVMPLFTLVTPNRDERAGVNWNFIFSLTSVPSRFASLPLVIDSLNNQQVLAKEIHINIAHGDIAQLDSGLRDELERKGLKIFAVDDLGPAKKLIPTLERTELPVIVVDDDLVYAPDLSLKILVQHHLYPNSVIATRTHRVALKETGEIEPFTQWSKQWHESFGPDPLLFATSGAGTLFTKELLHPDVFDVSTYQELAFFTDDLWWYFQARRNSVDVRRVPGICELNFIPDTQESGLWNTGNKDRNDQNLAALVTRYGNVSR